MFTKLLQFFHPVIIFPSDYEVLDFSSPKGSSEAPRSLYTIGRYNEKRPALYTQSLFGAKRNCHIGIDLGGPVGTPVHAFYDGSIFLFDDNQEPGDYGPTLVTRHRIDGVELYALYGHLSQSSLAGKAVGQTIASGEIIGWLGAESENGGWPPHVHFQLSIKAPARADMPGVVSEEDLMEALKMYPDPRIVLGDLY